MAYRASDGLVYEIDTSFNTLYIYNSTNESHSITSLAGGLIDGGTTLNKDAREVREIVIGTNKFGINVGRGAIIGSLGSSQLSGCTVLETLKIEAGCGASAANPLVISDFSLSNFKSLYIQNVDPSRPVYVSISPLFGKNCPQFNEFNVVTSLYKSINGVLYSEDWTALLNCPPAKTRANPAGSTVSIEDYAYAYCNIRSITIPDSTTTIGEYAFSDCTALTNMTLGASITQIEESAFDGDYNLVSIRFNSDSAPTFGQNSFRLGSPSHPLYTYVFSPNNWADGLLESYSTSDTTFIYEISSEEIINDIPVEIGDEAIFMSDPDRTTDFLLYHGANNGYNCIESYTIHGGSEQPFEYVTLTINKKQLSALAPDLANRIYAGRNRITLIGPGQGEYIVSSCKKSGQVWTIIAYSISELIRAVTLGQKINLESGGSNATTPKDIITSLIYTDISQYYVSGMYSLAPIVNAVFIYKDGRNSWLSESDSMPDMCFAKGTSVWYVIQVCAAKLGCKVWISHGILYVVDTSADFRNGPPAGYVISPNTEAFTEIAEIYLNRNEDFPYNPTEEQLGFMSNVVNLPAPGEEGPMVLRNQVTVKFAQERDPRTPDSDDATLVATTTGTPPQPQEGAGTPLGTITSGLSNSLVARSIEVYSPKAYSVEIKEIGLNNARAIAEQFAERYCDAETSISFNVRGLYKETDDGGNIHRVWYPTFPTLTHIHTLVDYSNDLVISTKCNYTVNNQYPVLPSKGMLSYVEHTFPEHISKYTFGISTPTDIAQDNSIIKNSINNG